MALFQIDDVYNLINVIFIFQKILLLPLRHLQTLLYFHTNTQNRLFHSLSSTHTLLTHQSKAFQSSQLWSDLRGWTKRSEEDCGTVKGFYPLWGMFRQRWRCTVPEAVWCRQVVTSSAQKPIKRNFRSQRAWGTLLHVCVLHEGRDTWSDLYSPFYLWRTFHILQANVNSKWTVQQSNTKLTIRKLLEMNAFYKFDLVTYLYFICVFF